MKYYTLFILLLCGGLSAQSVEFRYDYDLNGNRKFRETIHLRIAANDGSTTTDERFYKTALHQEEAGVTETLATLHVTLYPNPTVDEVRLEWSETDARTEMVRILDAQGKEVYRGTDKTGDFTVPFQNLEPGHYIIWLKTQQGVQRFPVIKQ